MQWSDITAPPAPKLLRQFAGLCLIVFGGLALWRVTHAGLDVWAGIFVVLAVVGVIGLVQPVAVRWVFTGWMIAAFPIGWTISRLMLMAMFYLVFTPFALVFRLTGRDVLRLTKGSNVSYWQPKRTGEQGDDYFRQF